MKTVHFNSTAEFLEACAKQGKPLGEREDLSSRKTTDNEWSGSRSFEHALSLARNGWSEAPRIDDLAASVQLRAESISNEMVYAHSGAFVDVVAFVAGEPECMVDFMEAPSRKPVRVLVNAGIACQASERQIAWRGAVILALHDALRKAGHACEILLGLFISGKSGANALYFTVKIQDSGSPLDVNALAFWLCQASVFRRLVFSYMENQSASMRRSFGSGYGYFGTEQKKRFQDASASLCADIEINQLARELPSTDACAVREFKKLIAPYSN